VVALTLAGGYDSAHVLGIPVLSATTLGLLLQRGMTSRLELSLGTTLPVLALAPPGRVTSWWRETGQ